MITERNPMSVELKIKSKHLALESGVIRFEERKIRERINELRNLQKPVDRLENTRYRLNEHRKTAVRNENRATFLARAYIARKPYQSVERDRLACKNSVFVFYVLPRVVAMVAKYDPKHSKSYTSKEQKDKHLEEITKAVKQWVSEVPVET